jgi:hypothetical protein
MVIVSYSLFLGLFGCCLFDEVNVMFGSPPFMSGSTINGFFFFFFFFCYYYVNHIGFLELEVLKVIFLTIAVNQIARGFGISQF